jgi:hypothetical protein
MVQGTVFVARYQMSSVQMKMVFVTQLVAGLRPYNPTCLSLAHACEPVACARVHRVELGSQETAPHGVSREPGAGGAFGCW